MRRPRRIAWIGPPLCLINIRAQRIGVEFALVMKYTLARVLRTSWILSENRSCSIVKTVSKEVDEPAEKDKKRYHCWAAVGHNFMSDIYFYDVPRITNGKMSQQVYIEPNFRANCEVLDPGSSRFCPGGRWRFRAWARKVKNIVRTWKERKENGLESYFNCHSSPDLAPIENCWQPVKRKLFVNILTGMMRQRKSW